MVIVIYNYIFLSAELKHLSPDRSKWSKLFLLCWFQSNAIVHVNAAGNKSRNIVTQGKRRYFASK